MRPAARATAEDDVPREIGVAYDGRSPLLEAAPVIRRALDAGASRVWMAEHLGFHQSFVGCALFAVQNPNATVIPTAISPYVLHPMVTAMALASLAEIAPGRVAVSVGVGSPGYLKESGIAVDKPIRAMREYIECLNALWTGKRVSYEGTFYKLDNAFLKFPPPLPIPVYIAAMGDQMLRLSGRLSDGVVLSIGLSPSYSRRMLDITAEGAQSGNRDFAKVRKISYLYCSVDADRRKAIAAVRPHIAVLLRLSMFADPIAQSGLSLDQEALNAALAKGDKATADKLVTDEIVEAFAVVGDPRSAADRLNAYLDAGIEEPVLNILGDNAGQELSYRLIREFAR